MRWSTSNREMRDVTGPMAVAKLMSVAGLTALALFPASAAHANPSFTGVGDLDGGIYESRVNAISADGRTVVGQSFSGATQEAFVWTREGGIQAIPGAPAGYDESEATGVSGDGSVIVGRMANGSDYEAFRWTAATGMVGLGSLPGGDWSSAQDVSRDGDTVVGHALTYGARAFRWTETEGMVPLADLPGGTAFTQATSVSADGTYFTVHAGATEGQGSYRGTSSGSVLKLPFPSTGYQSNYAHDITPDGQYVVGGAGGRAYRWKAYGALQYLGSPPGGDTGSVARAVSADASVIVGNYQPDYGLPNEAFIWDSTDGMQSVEFVLSTLGIDLTGWQLTNAFAVSDRGDVIAGVGINPNGDTEGWIAVVPEPTSGLLLATGIGLLAKRKRRR